MKRIAFFGLWVGWSAVAAGPAVSTSFQFKDDPSETDLTTARIWKLDPDVLNPYRTPWVLSRKATLFKVQTHAVQGRHHIRQGEVEVLSKILSRPLDVLGECASKAENQAKNSLQKVQQILRQQQANLEKKLQLISAASEGEAQVAAQVVFQGWITDLRLAEKITPSECVRDFEPWPSEPTADDYQKPYFRAPAKRWNGLFSIRFSTQTNARSITGQFLLDSSAPASLVSPEWIRSQGLRKELVEQLQRASQTWEWSGGKKLSFPARLLNTEMGGVKIPMGDMGLVNTQIFSSANFLAPCCDGVLGVDFLRRHVIESVPETPASLVAWQKAEFVGPKGFAGVEAFVDEKTQKVMSRCQLGSSAVLVEWRTAQEEAISASKSVKKNALVCNGVSILKDAALSGKTLRIGMPILARGRVIFDLPHGRIWFEKAGLDQPLPQNLSGLELAYKLNRFGERELKVEAIGGHSAASGKGFLVGARVLKINDIASEKTDLWSIQQILSGSGGQQILFEIIPPLRSALDDVASKKIVLQLPLSK